MFTVIPDQHIQTTPPVSCNQCMPGYVHSQLSSVPVWLCLQLWSVGAWLSACTVCQYQFVTYVDIMKMIIQGTRTLGGKTRRKTPVHWPLWQRTPLCSDELLPPDHAALTLQSLPRHTTCSPSYFGELSQQRGHSLYTACSCHVCQPASKGDILSTQPVPAMSVSQPAKGTFSLHSLFPPCLSASQQRGHSLYTACSRHVSQQPAKRDNSPSCVKTVKRREEKFGT